MRRIAIALLLGVAAQTSADVQVATSPSAKIPPGTYRAPSYSTRFDGEGHWVTMPGEMGGSYAIDGDVIAFNTRPAACADEMVTYRLRFEKTGVFRLQFLKDSCGRIQQMPDIIFVRTDARDAKVAR